MEEIIKASAGLIEKAPYAFAFIAAVFIVMKYGGSDFLKNFHQKGIYVKRDDCHNSIDTLRKLLDEKVDKLYDDIDHKLRDLQENIREFIKAMK